MESADMMAVAKRLDERRERKIYNDGVKKWLESGRDSSVAQLDFDDANRK